MAFLGTLQMKLGMYQPPPGKCGPGLVCVEHVTKSYRRKKEKWKEWRHFAIQGTPKTPKVLSWKMLPHIIRNPDVEPRIVVRENLWVKENMIHLYNMHSFNWSKVTLHNEVIQVAERIKCKKIKSQRSLEGIIWHVRI